MGYSPWGCKESDVTERFHFKKMWMIPALKQDGSQNWPTPGSRSFASAHPSPGCQLAWSLWGAQPAPRWCQQSPRDAECSCLGSGGSGGPS